MMTGQEFVKWLKPAGAALFLVVAVLVTWICLTAGQDPIPGYEPPQSSEYYAQHLDELKEELERNVIPKLEGEAFCEASGDKLIVTLTAGNFAVTRSAIIQYFDPELFEFIDGREPENGG